MKFQLTCCSTVDLSLEYMQERKIPFCSLHYIINDVIYDDDFGQTMPSSELYKRMKSENITPTTSQVNEDEYVKMFKPILERGEDIVHLTLSSGISGTYGSAVIAAERMRKLYPDRKIFVVDSLCASAGSGLLLDAMCDMRDSGASAEETAKWAEENKLKLNHWFYSYDLSNYKRGGRISPSAANIGTILNICPLMHVDNEGKLVPVKKILGKRKAAQASVQKMKENALGGVNYGGKCFISQSACYSDARYLADLIEAEFKDLNGKVRIFDIGATIGSHTGNGTVALFFFGSKRD